MKSKITSKSVARCSARGFFNPKELETLNSLIDIFLPDAEEYVPIAEILGSSLWRIKWRGSFSLIAPRKIVEYKQGLTALDSEARRQYGENFSGLRNDSQIELLEKISHNLIDRRIWKFPADVFFKDLAYDIVYIYNSFSKRSGQDFFSRFYNPKFS